MKTSFLGLVIALVTVWGVGAESVPSAVRPPVMKAKAARLAVPRSFAAGLENCEARVTLGALDMDAIAAQDAARAVSGEKTLRIGVGRALPERVAVAGLDGGAGEWSELDDGSRVWRLTVDVPGALGVRMLLSGVELPEGCELLVHDADDPSAARGPYSAGKLDGRREFWTGAVFAESVTLECYVPRGTMPDDVALELKQVAHIYRDPAAPFIFKEGSCHKDVACYPEWKTTGNGVAGVGIFIGYDYFFCTGCLLNDKDESTWIDYFLTANHCVANQREANDLEFYWFYQKANCSDGTPSIASSTITGWGAEFLTGKDYKKGSDFTLLRLREWSPDGAIFNGWSTATPSRYETLACIHHPDGTHKRISFANLEDSDADFWGVNFYSGATEPGSSGAPLLNANKQVIGQLTGGFSSCADGGGFDAFGRFDAAFALMSKWLTREAGSLLPAANPPFGSYNGLVYRDRDFADEGEFFDLCGTLTVTPTKTGKISAKAVLRHKTVSFKSAAWEGSTVDGWFVVTLRAAGGETLELKMDWLYAEAWIYGGSLGDEVLMADVSYDIFGDSGDSYAKEDLAWLRGSYTAALPVMDCAARGPALELPNGSGYLTLTVGNKGSVKIAGKLADGTAVSQSAKLLQFLGYGQDVCVPLFRPLYSKKGAVGGMLWIDSWDRTLLSPWEAGSYVRWVKPGAGPDGFEALLALCGGYYDKAAALAAGGYVLCAESNAVPYYVSGGAVEPQAAALPLGVRVDTSGKRLVPIKGVKPVLVDGAYVYSETNSAMTSLSFTASSGIYKGSFKLYYDYMEKERLKHKAVTASYAGVLTQSRSRDFDYWPEGLGYYVVPDSDPAFKKQKLKRSFWMDLYIAP